jgi:hypothetical protein
VLRIAKARGAGDDKQLRDPHHIHVLLDGGIGRGAERAEDQQHGIALDQLARLLHRLRRTVAVIVGDEVDLAAVDAAIVVDHAEIGTHRLADDAVGRRRPTIGHDVANLDLGIGYAGVVFFWANALPTLAAIKMMAVENAAIRRATKDIPFLPAMEQ